MRDVTIPPRSQDNYNIQDDELVECLTEKIIKYLDLGALLGPFLKDEIPFDNYFLSPITGLWKKYPFKATLIQNLSAPKNNSINSTIPEEVRYTEYPSLEYLIETALAVGIGGYLWIIDLKDSYFILPILKKFIHLFGAKWLDKYIFYACLPFGLATSPRLFQTWADCIKFIVEESNPKLFNVNGLNILTHYLDDFWAGHPDFDEASKQFYKLFHLLEVLGIPTSEDKCTKPTTCLTIIGFLLNTLTQCVSIPPEKIKQYLQDIDLLLKFPYKCTIKKTRKNHWEIASLRKGYVWWRSICQRPRI